jgi:hypothetical protein
LRDQSLVKITKDHSFVGFLEDSGRLSEQEAMAHPKRNEINKALGFDPQIDLRTDYIEIGSSPFLPGDVLLLCSDGLSDLVDNKNMTSILVSSQTLPQKGQALIDAANNAGGKDNITVVIVSNNKKPIKLKATKPAQAKKKESNEEVAAVAPAKPITEKRFPSRIKKSFKAVTVLSVLCLLLAGACVWLWLRDEKEQNPITAAVQYTPNEGEKTLTDSLGLAERSLFLSEQVLGKSVVLGDTLFVRQDTLRINGNGVVLSADSSYTGPALVATNNNKFLLLENITFKDFATAILLQNKGVQLVNVLFQNCKVPVQHHLILPSDSVLNGMVRDTFIVTHNSLPKY